MAAADADVQAFAYLPEAFTHAKLLGAVSGNRGWLLSGSANLSNAALTFSGGPAGSGNVELAVFAALSADDLRRTFLPPETEAEERPLASLAALSFDSEPDVRSDLLIRITHATALPDGRVEITTSPDLDDTLRLSDHKDVTSLEFDGERATTSGSLAGPLVHLVDEWNRPVSNHVIIDDPESLRRVLETGDDRGARSRPAELNLTDLDTPLGQALLHLHRNVVMDVSETAGRGGGIDATREEASDNDADDDLWDRLEREKLGRDPRASTYSRLFRSASSPELSDALIELLDAMRERAPGQHSHEQTLLRTISGPIPPINEQ